MLLSHLDVSHHQTNFSKRQKQPNQTDLNSEAPPDSNNWLLPLAVRSVSSASLWMKCFISEAVEVFQHERLQFKD